MTTKTNNADHGANGTVVTIVNSGGANGDAFHNVYVTSPATVKFQDGTYEFTATGGGPSAIASWNLSAFLQSGRVEVYLPSALNVGGVGGAGVSLISLRHVDGSVRFNFRVNDDNHFEIRHNYNNFGVDQIRTDSGVVPTIGSWFRIEYAIDFTTGGGPYDIRIYPGRTSTTATYTFSGTSTGIRSGTPTITYLGMNSPYANVMRMDNLAINDTGVLIGPYLLPSDVDAVPISAAVSTSAPTVHRLVDAVPVSASLSLPPPTALTSVLAAVPISAAVSLPSPTAPDSPVSGAGPNNNLFENAWEITIAANGREYRSGLCPNSAYTREGPNEPAIDSGPWNRVAWWRYRPIANGTWRVNMEGTVGGGVDDVPLLKVLRLEPAGTLTGLGIVSGNTTRTTTVTAGSTYYVRVGFESDVDASYVVNSIAPTGTQPQTALPANDVRADAAEVVIDAGGVFEAAPTPPDLLTVNFDGVDDRVGGQFDATAAAYVRSAWWVYRPLTTGAATLDFRILNMASTTGGSLIHYEDDAGELLPLGYQANLSTVDLAVTAGTVYYFAAVTQYDDSFQTYRMTVSGPATMAVPPLVDAAPISAAVSLPAPSVPDSSLVTAPAISATVGTAASPVVSVAAEPISAGVSVRAGDIRRVRYGLLEPEDDTIVPVLRPTFAVAVTIIEGNIDAVGVDIQYGVDLDVSPTTVSTVVELLDNANVVEVDATEDLELGETYQWRMRLIVDEQERDWTEPWTFTIGTTAAVASIPITCSVTSAATYPHLWLLDPNGGAPGDHITVIGHGFPAAETGVLFGDDDVDVVSWTHVAATADATTADRYIGEDLVDPEHDEVVIVVPDTLEPGDAVTVKGEDD